MNGYDIVCEGLSSFWRDGNDLLAHGGNWDEIYHFGSVKKPTKEQLVTYHRITRNYNMLAKQMIPVIIRVIREDPGLTSDERIRFTKNAKEATIPDNVHIPAYKKTFTIITRGMGSHTYIFHRKTFKLLKDI